MNITGDFVRRAAANVSSQLSSTVSSVAGVRKKSDLSSTAKEKFTMTIKVNIVSKICSFIKILICIENSVLQIKML